MIARIAFFLAVVWTGLSPAAHAQPFQNELPASEPVKAEILVEQETIQPGRPFWVAVRLNLEDKWHAYWKNPGDAGMPPVIEWQLPEGFEAGEVLFPVPEKHILNGAVSFGYSDEVILLAEIQAPPHASGEISIGADISWVACDDSSCLPGGESVNAAVPVQDKKPALDTQHKDSFNRARKAIPQSLSRGHAESRDDLITLHLDTPHDIVEASFFPEEMGRVDPAADPFISEPAGSGVKIVLKEGEEALKNANLKGVVLLKDSSGEEIAYEVDLPVRSPQKGDVALGETPSATAPLRVQGYNGGFLLALGLAFAGGLLLNLMPCVLPVISFKVLSFVKMAGQSRALTFRHGVAFSLGVILSFWVLAGALLGLQAYGHAVGWGFQLQEPLFVAALAAVILIFGLSMFGVFEVGSSLATMAGQAQAPGKSSGLSGSFFSGILATAVATPCTGPFLGTAVGFAVTLPAFSAMLIFTFLGIGMAFPYLLLGAFPGLLNYLPKPGNWMVTFKEIMGFVMFATVLWLIWVFGAQTDALALFFLLVGFFFIAIACWIYGKWGSPVNKRNTRLASYITSIPFLCLGAYALFFASTVQSFEPDRQEIAALDDKPECHGKWERFSPERVAELRERGVPVFIDFTAKWCLICQANHLVLTGSEVEKKFDELGVVRMKADWTKRDPVITEALMEYGRNSVPLYLLYGADPEQPADILPQVLTSDIVLEHLSKLAAQK